MSVIFMIFATVSWVHAGSENRSTESTLAIEKASGF